MPRFAANLSMLFNEHAFLDRFEAAAKAGFLGVEFLFPYAEDKAVLAEKLAANGLTQVLFNLPPGNWDAGERGIACLPDRVGEFQDGVGKAIDYARALGNRQVNCLSGIAPAGVPREQMLRTLVENLRFAAEKLKEVGILLIVEPINFYDMPGFFLNRSSEAVAIFDEVGSDNIKLQYDIYHMQRMEGELAATIERLLPRIAHIQIADNPGRHEPGTGEINYPFLFALLDRLGYPGWVSCEYRPKAGTLAGLGWMAGTSRV
ncbi:MAG TPA: hydroxypyruvate isomerase [Beijerinckiaceae bacterium]|nr:hydroxypyruvate isomerase [Beijerinckiaceae bacterium]